MLPTGAIFGLPRTRCRARGFPLHKLAILRGRMTVELTARETEIVALLAEGHSDETIATRLGMSRRSIAYAIAGLMRRFQVSNRFQLGWLLGADTARQPEEEG